jgi:hypothetical protein
MIVVDKATIFINAQWCQAFLYEVPYLCKVEEEEVAFFFVDFLNYYFDLFLLIFILLLLLLQSKDNLIARCGVRPVPFPARTWSFRPSGMELFWRRKRVLPARRMQQSTTGKTRNSRAKDHGTVVEIYLL